MTQKQKERLEYLQALTTDPDFYRLLPERRKALIAELDALKAKAK